MGNQILTLITMGAYTTKINRRIIGRARYNLPDGDKRHVWVRLHARYSEFLQDLDLSAAKWKVMGGVLADGPNNTFSFTIPEDYDLDVGDVLTAYTNQRGGVWWSSRVYGADAWTGTAEKKRAPFTWMELSVRDR